MIILALATPGEETYIRTDPKYLFQIISWGGPI
jgi:hypothetical protein